MSSRTTRTHHLQALAILLGVLSVPVFVAASTLVHDVDSWPCIRSLTLPDGTTITDTVYCSSNESCHERRTATTIRALCLPFTSPY